MLSAAPPPGLDGARAAVVMALSGVRTGASVLDLGAGTGLIARAAAAAASATGRVVSCDDAAVLDVERRRDAMAGLAPVVRVAAAPARLPVPDGAYDNVLLVGTRWRLSDVGGEIRRATRVGARVVVRADAADVSDAARILGDLGFEVVHLSESQGARPADCHLVVRRAA